MRRQELRIWTAADGPLLERDALAEVLRRAEDAVVEAARRRCVRLACSALEVGQADLVAETGHVTLCQGRRLALLSPVAADAAGPILLGIEGGIERGRRPRLPPARRCGARRSRTDRHVRARLRIGQSADRVQRDA